MMSKISYTNSEHVEADITRWIETGNECEVMAARMLKAQLPLLIEILHSRNLSYVSGFVRGISNIAAAMVVSLPPEMREGVASCIKADLDRAFAIALKGPPKK
jgi:hypothetical protein